MKATLPQIIVVLVAFASAVGTYDAVPKARYHSGQAAPWPGEAAAAVAIAVGIAVLAIASLSVPMLSRVPRDRRVLAWSSLAGWTVASLLVALIVSWGHALGVRLGPDRLMVPQEWIYARAAIGGLLLAVIPAAVVVQLASRSPASAPACH